MNTLRQRLLKRKNNKGFTLIELVIVVVIIGILTAIAIPSYGAIQGTSKQNAVTTAAKDQFLATQAALASGGTVEATGWTQASRNSQIAVSITKTRAADPLSETNIYVQAVWLKATPTDGTVSGANMDTRYIKTIYTLADGRVVSN